MNAKELRAKWELFQSMREEKQDAALDEHNRKKALYRAGQLSEKEMTRADARLGNVFEYQRDAYESRIEELLEDILKALEDSEK